VSPLLALISDWNEFLKDAFQDKDYQELRPHEQTDRQASIGTDIVNYWVSWCNILNYKPPSIPSISGSKVHGSKVHGSKIQILVLYNFLIVSMSNQRKCRSINLERRPRQPGPRVSNYLAQCRICLSFLPIN